MRVISVFFLAGFLFAAGEKQSDTFVFKYGQSQSEDNTRGQSMVLFEKRVEELSNGRIQVENYFSAVLGNESEMMDLMVTGSLQGTRGGLFRNANPKFAIFELPFLVKNWEEALRLLHSDFTKEIAKGAEKEGVYIPAVGITQGFRAHTNNVRPINRPEDLVGLKMRVPPSKIYLYTSQTFGAQSFEIPGADMYQALRLGTVDGQDNPPINIYNFKLQEVQKYLSISNYSFGPDPLMVNLAWFQSLPEDLQQVFNQAAVEAMAYSDEIQEKGENDFIDLLADSGMEVNYITGENLQAFRVLAEKVYQHFIDQGDFTLEEINEARAYARGEMM